MIQPEPRLRAATPTDIEAMNSIMRESSAYSGRYRVILEGYAITPEQVARDHFALAEKAGSTLGFYSLVTAPEPELDLMFVSDQAQGLGVGRTLIRHMLAVAAGLGFESVKIVSHPPSAGFYQRMGAYQAGVHPPSGRISWERPVLRIHTPLHASASAGDAGPFDPL